MVHEASTLQALYCNAKISAIFHTSKLFNKLFGYNKITAYLCAMKNVKRGRPVGVQDKKKRAKNTAKVLFRERWNRAWAKLSPQEAKSYATIINSTRAICGQEPISKMLIYTVTRGNNNSAYAVLESLEEYVACLECF